jgi:S-adenosylmethionine:tRNA ribosyltransferase-isomerase
MKLSDLDYEFPEELIATTPSRPTRVMWVENDQAPLELTLAQVLEKIPAGDILVINNTKVLKRRVFAETDVEILFLDQVSESEKSNSWKVLFPSKKFAVGSELKLPLGHTMKLIEKGRPQIVEVSPPMTEADFEKCAELPLPPYIQKARQERHNVKNDESWYQTAWAEKPGSMAAPTASLHFSETDIASLRKKGVQVVEVTLHVGLGTFLPVTVEDLNQHVMHSEVYDISASNWNLIKKAKAEGHHIWSLGTTTTRVLESVARTGKLSGETDILLQVGSEFKIIDRLMTNFHQPQSTLLALVSGFAGLEKVKKAYAWAIERRFKLFSYGDFSIWLK